MEADRDQRRMRRDAGPYSQVSDGCEYVQGCDPGVPEGRPLSSTPTFALLVDEGQGRVARISSFVFLGLVYLMRLCEAHASVEGCVERLGGQSPVT